MSILSFLGGVAALTLLSCALVVAKLAGWTDMGWPAVLLVANAPPVLVFGAAVAFLLHVRRQIEVGPEGDSSGT